MNVIMRREQLLRVTEADNSRRDVTVRSVFKFHLQDGSVLNKVTTDNDMRTIKESSRTANLLICYLKFPTPCLSAVAEEASVQPLKFILNACSFPLVQDTVAVNQLDLNLCEEDHRTRAQWLMVWVMESGATCGVPLLVINPLKDPHTHSCGNGLSC